MMRLVQTPAFALEPQMAAHAAEMFDVLADPAIYQHENESPESLEWLRERFARLESRRSPDGKQQWLNWVVRLSSGELAGYVQATVHGDRRAAIAYVFASRYWGRGLATAAVVAMIGELRQGHGVRSLTAVLKQSNLRSRRLLERLGFRDADPHTSGAAGIEPDESMMLRVA